MTPFEPYIDKLLKSLEKKGGCIKIPKKVFDDTAKAINTALEKERISSRIASSQATCSAKTAYINI